MSTDYRLSTPVRIEDVFGGALEEYGIREEIVPEHTTPRARCLGDGTNWVWVYADEEGIVSRFTCFGHYNVGEAILASRP